MGGSYRDLRVWQKSVELSVDVYRFTKNFPREELYGLTSQLRRAGVSVASNIAEGQGRVSRREFHRFVGIARGSVLEMQTQLEIAGKLGFGVDAKRELVEAQAEDLSKMLWGLMQKLNNSSKTLISDEPLAVNREASAVKREP
jgi:four helix bundle protein